jgi:hypothetical protein
MRLLRIIFSLGVSINLLLVSCGSPPSALTPTTTSTELPPPEANIIVSLNTSDVLTGQTVDLAVDTSAPEMAAYIESYQELHFQELQFKWSVKRGTLSALEGPFVIYTAPDTPGLDTITLEVVSALGTTTKSVSFNVNVSLTDTLTPTSTPLPPPLREIFPQVGNGVEFIFPEDQPNLIKKSFIETGDCSRSGPFGLQLIYNFTAGGGGGWGVHWTSAPTGRFDASSFDALTFWIRGTIGNESFQVALKDTHNRAVRIESRSLLIVTPDWTRVIAPLSAFQDVDISSLENILISFDSNHGSGSICIDDFAFAKFAPTTTITPELTVIPTGIIETLTPSLTPTLFLPGTPTPTPSTSTIIAQTLNATQIFQSIFATVDSQYQDLKSNIAYNAPKSMKLNDTVIVELLLNPSKPPAELITQVVEEGGFVTSTGTPGELIGGPGVIMEVVTSNIQITDRMKAVLKSQEPDAFVIQELHDNPEHPISGINTTKWSWSVTAKEKGTKTLIIVISRLIKQDDREYWVEVESYNANIIVEVTMSQWLSGLDWRWFLTALPIPLFWWWLNNRRKKGDDQKSSSQPKKRYKR